MTDILSCFVNYGILEKKEVQHCFNYRRTNLLSHAVINKEKTIRSAFCLFTNMVKGSKKSTLMEGHSSEIHENYKSINRLQRNGVGSYFVGFFYVCYAVIPYPAVRITIFFC